MKGAGRKVLGVETAGVRGAPGPRNKKSGRGISWAEGPGLRQMGEIPDAVDGDDHHGDARFSVNALDGVAEGVRGRLSDTISANWAAPPSGSGTDKVTGAWMLGRPPSRRRHRRR